MNLVFVVGTNIFFFFSLIRIRKQTVYHSGPDQLNSSTKQFSFSFFSNISLTSIIKINKLPSLPFYTKADFEMINFNLHSTTPEWYDIHQGRAALHLEEQLQAKHHLPSPYTLQPSPGALAPTHAPTSTPTLAS